MIKTAYSTTLIVLVSIALSSCVNTSDKDCGHEKAMTHLSNLGMVSAYFRENEASFSKEEREGLLVIASTMAASAAIEGAPGENEMRGIHENGLLWLMDQREELVAIIDPATFALIDKTYSPIVGGILDQRSKMVPTHLDKVRDGDLSETEAQ